MPVLVSNTTVTYISLKDGLDVLDFNRGVRVDGERVSSRINKCEHTAGGCLALAKLLHEARNVHVSTCTRKRLVLTTFHLILHHPGVLTRLCDALIVET